VNDGEGIKALRKAYQDFSQAAYVGMYREPYAVIQKTKGESRPNFVPNRKAESVSDFIDRECAKVAQQAYRRGDYCLSDERKCRKCSVLYKIRPDHNGLCLLCEMDI
jgi:hypothetical protein